MRLRAHTQQPRWSIKPQLTPRHVWLYAAQAQSDFHGVALDAGTTVAARHCRVRALRHVRCLT